MHARSAANAPSDTAFRFVLDAFPLIVCVSPRKHGTDTIERMAEGYERLFARGERYALISATPRDADGMGARERKQIADWANSPRVRSASKELCVGSATIVGNALARGALTAILWLWKPSSPHQVFTANDEAIDWCLGQLEAARVRQPQGAAATRAQVRALLRSL